MTDKEKAIVMAYTGIAMLTGDKFDIFHKYVEDIMGRPVFTHEFATCAEEIKEKAKPDFLKLCAEEGEERPHGEWILTYPYQDKHMVHRSCSSCGDARYIDDTDYFVMDNFCPNCGSDNRRKEGGADNEM